MIPCAIGSVPTFNDLSGRTETIAFGKTKLANAFSFCNKIRKIELKLCTRSMRRATPIKEIVHATGTRKYSLYNYYGFMEKKKYHVSSSIKPGSMSLTKRMHEFF